MKKLIILFFFMVICFAGCKKDEGLENVSLYPFFNETGKWGYIDNTGNVRIEPQWNQANRFIMDRTVVWLNYKPAMIDKNVNVIVPFDEYQDLAIMNADVSVLFNPKFLVGARKNGLWGFLGKDGEVKIPFQYENVNNFLDGMAAVRISGKYGFIDENGNLDIPAIYDGRGWFSEGLCWVGILTGGVIKWGVINKLGETVIPFDYDNNGGDLYKIMWYRFVNGKSPWFSKSLGSGFINTNGEKLFGLTGTEYDWTANYSEGLAAVSIDNMVGFINTNGNQIIPVQYRNVFDFVNGSAPFRYTTEELWGYLNKNGEVIIEQQFLTAQSIIEGLGWVQFQDSTAGYIDKNGNTVWQSAVIPGSWN
jgi:hypothetical protein